MTTSPAKAPTKALIIVDVQNDFIPGGTLAVPEGDKVVPIINRLQPLFPLIVATQDWHPPNHGSFAAQHGRKPGEIIDLSGLSQILWPVHCIQGTWGAEFHPDLDLGRINRIFHKGTDPTIDSYSALFDNGHRKATGLGDYLKSEGVTDMYIAGLATDYCVKFTALDARQLGFNVHVIRDACRGVELQTGDIAAALDQMRKAGVEVITSADL